MADAETPPAPPAAPPAAGEAEGDAGDGYVPAAKVDLATLVAKDAGDESLARYKAALLGAAATASSAAAAAAAGETRHVVIHSIRILVAGRPDVVMPLATSQDVAGVEAGRVVVKEGVEHRICITFSVHRDIVSGLRFTNKVFKLGIPVDTDRVVIGSYAPRAEPYEFTLPPQEWPSGMLARGNYTARATFTDDDGATHLDVRWAFAIAREWS